MRVVALVAVLVGTICAQEIGVAFLGLQRGAAPSFEQSLEDRIRRELAASGEWPTVDSRRTLLMRKAVRLDEHNHGVSRQLIEELRQNGGDGTLVVWGVLEGYDVRARRRRLFGAQAVAKAELVLSLYSLTMESFVYVGRHEFEASLRMPPVFFRRVEQATHISSRDRVALHDMISDQIAPHAVGLVRAVGRRVGPHEEELPEIEDVETQNVPTVQDLFDFPGMEGESIEEELPAEEPLPETEEPSTSE